MSSPQDPQDPFRAPSDDERAGGSRPPQGSQGSPGSSSSGDGGGFGWGSGPQDPARSSWESSQGSPQQGGWGAPGDGQGQQPYGAPAPYAAPGQGYPAQGGGYGPPPDHPRATTAMVLGIGGLVGSFLCLLPILLSPFAMVMGRRVVKEIDASQGRQGGRGQAQAGFVLGVIGTVLLALGVLGVVLFVVLVASVGF